MKWSDNEHEGQWNSGLETTVRSSISPTMVQYSVLPI